MFVDAVVLAALVEIFGKLVLYGFSGSALIVVSVIALSSVFRSLIKLGEGR